VGHSAQKALEHHRTISCPTSAQVIDSAELVQSPRERQLFQTHSKTVSNPEIDFSNFSPIGRRPEQSFARVLRRRNRFSFKMKVDRLMRKIA
jgi:hypothetical protein